MTDASSPFLGLHHTQLAIPAGGEDDARAFYGQGLGLEEIEKPPVLAARGGCWFRGGGLELHLGVESPFNPARKAHPGILTDDIEQVGSRLSAHGFPVEWDDAFPGFRRFYSHDRHGNRVEVLEAETPT